METKSSFLSLPWLVDVEKKIAHQAWQMENILQIEFTPIVVLVAGKPGGRTSFPHQVLTVSLAELLEEMLCLDSYKNKVLSCEQAKHMAKKCLSLCAFVALPNW